MKKKILSICLTAFILSSALPLPLAGAAEADGIIWQEDFTGSRYENGIFWERFSDDTVANSGFVTGFGGKAANDASFVIHGNGETYDKYNEAGVQTVNTYLQREGDDSFTFDSDHTLEFSFCNNADAVAVVELHTVDSAGNKSTVELIKSYSNAKTAIAPVSTSGEADIGLLEKGRWHHVKAEFHVSNNRIHVYVDGVYRAYVFSSFKDRYIDYIKFEMRGDKDANDNPKPATGFVAYDDIVLRSGTPQIVSNVYPGLISDKYYIDKANRVIYGAVLESAEDFAANVTPEQGGTLALDDDSVIRTDSIAVAEYTNKNGDKLPVEYTFSADSYVSPLYLINTGTGTDDILTATATVCPGESGLGNEAKFILATYRYGMLTSIDVVSADISSKVQLTAQTTVNREDNTSSQIFLWDSALTPIAATDVTTSVARTTVFDDDSEWQKLLSQSIALHARSGLLTAYGEKTLLANKPYKKNGTLYVAPAEISNAIGISCSISGNTVTVGSSTVTADAANAVDGVTYITAEEYFSDILGGTIYEVNNEYNSGAIIASDSEFTLPTTQTELQSLNDYLYNLRPSAQTVYDMYNASPLKGEHPRIYISSDDVERIKSECETNEYKKAWKESIIASADYSIKNHPIVEYTIDEGGRLLGVSRKVLDYMHTVGMAYLLTGDSKYPDYAFKQLKAASEFPDWHPDHSLDTGEMAAAFAVGYDWMYHGFTPEQRDTIEKGFYKHGIGAANNLYEGTDGRVSAVTAESNWNAVTNGGIATGAIAFMDVYPQSTSRIISNAIRGYDYMIWRFAPEGAWFEGPGYWEYTIKYTTKMLSSFKRILGTDFGFTRCEGLDTTCNYILDMQSALGAYAYGDGMQNNYYVPEIMWFADVFDKPEYVSSLLTLSGGNMANSEDRALALCWYDTSIDAQSVSLPTDSLYDGEGVMSMRSGWDAADSYFAASAGKTDGSHDHLDTGGFVFDTGGVRWSHDLGQGNYNNTEKSYWDEKSGGERWQIFRIRAEAHSTVVINPTTIEDQKLNAEAVVTRFDGNDQSGIAAIDMTETQSLNANSALRGFAFCDSRSSLVVRDEITLNSANESNDIYWFMMTKADVNIISDGAILTATDSDGNVKTLYLKFISDGADSVSVTCAPAAPIDTTGAIVTDDGDSDYNRIAIRLNAKSAATVNITVSLSMKEDNNLLDIYNNPISTWTLE